MSVKSAEMKVVVGAQTDGFAKEMKGAKSALNDFHRSCDGALSALGEQFGLSTKQISQITNSIKGLGVELTKSGSEGVKAFGNILSSAGKLTGILGGLGLAAAVAGFKQLNSEVENFKTTLAGANLELQTQAYISTYKQALSDANKESVSQLANMEENLKRWWGRVKANVGGFASNVMLGAMGMQTTSKEDRQAARDNADALAERAAQLQKEIFDLQRKQKDNLVEISKLDAQIAEARERASDADLSSSERLEAINRAQSLINQKYALQLPIQQSIAEKMQEMNNLVSSSPAQIDAANQALIQANNLRASQSNELRATSKIQASLTKSVQEEALATAAIAASRAQLKDWAAQATGGADLTSGATTSMGGGIIIPVKPVVDDSGLIDMAQSLNSSIGSIAAELSESIGSLVGDLINGEGAWGNFANSAISAFGDMAISIGKVAVAAGIASKGILESLKLKPELAIAAGAALIAVGAAVKTSLGNIASGGSYSSSSNVASSYSGGGSAGGGYATQNINVKVSGKLVGQGSSLVAVIENEGKRMNATT